MSRTFRLAGNRADLFSRRGVSRKRLRVECLEDRRVLAVFVVDTLADEMDGSIDDMDVSLRDAIALSASGDTVTFDERLDGGTILLTLGELTIDGPLTIDASPLAMGLTIDASGNDPTPETDNGDGSRVFNANRLSLDGLTLTGADAEGGGGAILARNVTVRDSVLIDNHATAGGGGISAHGDAFFSGSVTLIRSTISGNSTSWRGGGIGVDYKATVTISDSTISNNSARRGGGGVFAYISTVSVATSTISGNTAGEEDGTFYDGNGGGVYVDDGTVAITASTISSNVAGGDELGISVGNGGGVFVNDGSLVARDSTVTGNTAGNHGGGLYADDVTTITSVISNNVAASHGGGIVVAAASVDSTRIMSIDFSTVTGNTAKTGGGIWSGANVETRVTSSTISGNSAAGAGGGIFADHTVTVSQSTVSENEAGHSGGGISAQHDTTISSSTVSGNTSGGAGAGMYVESGDVTVISSTISGNAAGAEGGGIYTESGDVSIASSTISGNSAARVGGVYSDGRAVTIDNSIIAGNFDEGTAPDFLNVRRFASITNTLIGDNTASGLTESQAPDVRGNLIGDPSGGGIIDPLLGPLQNHGGPTRTHALLAESPAIDAGDPNHAGLADHDQRGAPFVRVSGGRIDMGAYEFQPLPADFDQDGEVHCADVDRLVASIAEGRYAMELDLTQDDIVDREDLEAWLMLGGMENLASRDPYAAGDVNLDGKVDVNDLNIVGLNWLRNADGWCRGDVSADGIVDVNDLNLLALNWLDNRSGTASAAALVNRRPRAPVASSVQPATGVSPRFHKSMPLSNLTEHVAVPAVPAVDVVWKPVLLGHRAPHDNRNFTTLPGDQTADGAADARSAVSATDEFLELFSRLPRSWFVG